MSDAELATATRARVVDAALRCIAAEGLRRTTVDDIATAAGVSRATLYRAFPGGRDTVIASVVDAERARFTGVLFDAMAPHRGLREAVIAAVRAAATFLTTHEALDRVMFDDPAAVLTHLEFEQMDATLAAATASLGPLFGRFVPGEAAARAAEWATRVVLSYLLYPADATELTVEADAAALVDRHLLPGIVAIAADCEAVRH